MPPRVPAPVRGGPLQVCHLLAQEVQQVNQWWSSAEGEAYYETLKDRFKARILVPRPAANAAPTAQR